MFKTAGLLSTLVILKLAVVCVVFQLAISYLHNDRAELPAGLREIIIVAESPRVETIEELIAALEHQIASSQRTTRRRAIKPKATIRRASRGPAVAQGREATTDNSLQLTVRPVTPCSTMSGPEAPLALAGSR